MLDSGAHRERSFYFKEVVNVRKGGKLLLEEAICAWRRGEVGPRRGRKLVLEEGEG